MNSSRRAGQTFLASGLQCTIARWTCSRGLFPSRPRYLAHECLGRPVETPNEVMGNLVINMHTYLAMNVWMSCMSRFIACSLLFIRVYTHWFIRVYTHLVQAFIRIVQIPLIRIQNYVYSHWSVVCCGQHINRHTRNMHTVTYSPFRP